VSKEILVSGRGTYLRKNYSQELMISIDCISSNKILIINNTSVITTRVKKLNLKVSPKEYYMIINIGAAQINIKYDQDVSKHKIIYNPYKYEHSEKINFKPEEFVKNFNVPQGYIDILAKWYSIKFTYPEYNLIFIKPEMGLSLQIHKFRSEVWEIIRGNPIIISNNRVYYFVKNGTEFTNSKMKYHSIINPNMNPKDFIILKEKWSGNFDEEDIERIYNPNNYK
jgi:mannose-6-phosphate isomerase-like protein (cupin superfamily)